MTQHDQCAKELNEIFPKLTSRLFSAFSRLATYMNCPTQEFTSIELAESGYLYLKNFSKIIKYILIKKNYL